MIRKYLLPALASASRRGTPFTSSGTAAFSAAVSGGSRLSAWNTNPIVRPR